MIVIYNMFMLGTILWAFGKDEDWHITRYNNVIACLRLRITDITAQVSLREKLRIRVHRTVMCMTISNYRYMHENIKRPLCVWQSQRTVVWFLCAYSLVVRFVVISTHVIIKSIVTKKDARCCYSSSLVCIDLSVFIMHKIGNCVQWGNLFCPIDLWACIAWIHAFVQAFALTQDTCCWSFSYSTF